MGILLIEGLPKSTHSNSVLIQAHPRHPNCEKSPFIIWFAEAFKYAIQAHPL